MKWIKCLERLPEIGATILVEYFSGDYERKKYIGPEDWWLRNVNAWLDETERSFTIEDIKNAYDAGWLNGHNKKFDSPDKYIRNVYNIDITK